MKINSISKNQSFGKLKINIDKELLKSAPLKKDLEEIKNIFYKNKFHLKRNVNVILDYDTLQNKFVGIIESKKQGIPYNPDYKKAISSKKRDIKSFKDWLDNWNYMYSKKGMEEYKKLKEHTLKIISDFNKKLKT